MTVRNATIVGFIIGFLLGFSPMFAGLSNLVGRVGTIIAFVLFLLNWKRTGEWGGFVGGFLLGVAVGALVQGAPS